MLSGSRRNRNIEPSPLKKAWFSNCAYCDDEQPTEFCHQCHQAYCESCCALRHEVGKYQDHIKNIEKINAFLEITCHDCKGSFPITDHIYCRNCSIFLCKVCDQYLHIEGEMKNHDRESYVSTNQSQFFFCPGCSEINLSTPQYWCHDCQMAYCAYHNTNRHKFGKYQNHKNNIEEINENLKLKCSDCKSDTNLKELSFCQKCNALYCRICYPFFHKTRVQHERIEYTSQGTVIKLKDQLPEQPRTLIQQIFMKSQSYQKNQPKPKTQQSSNQSKQLKEKPQKKKSFIWTCCNEADDTIESGDEDEGKKNVPFVLRRGELKDADIRSVRSVGSAISSEKNGPQSPPAKQEQHQSLPENNNSQQPPKEQQPEVVSNDDSSQDTQTHHLKISSMSSSIDHLHEGWENVSNVSDSNIGQGDDDIGSAEDLEFFKEELRTSGIIVFKHGRSGKVKKVRLTCNEECTTLYWNPPTSKESTSSASINQVDFEEVNEVRAGIESDPDYPRYAGTPVLRRSLHPSRANKALSLIWDERSLDLQFASVEECAHAYTGFILLLREKKKWADR